MEIAGPSDETLKEVYESVRRRSKAIRHRGGTLTYARVIERENECETEKLEFSYRSNRAKTSPVIRMYVWSDRWVWIDARKSAKRGWEWEWTGEGRVFGPSIGQFLTKAFENSISEMTRNNENTASNIEVIWNSLLSDGRLKLVE